MVTEDMLTEAKQEIAQEIEEFIAWIVEAIEFVPMPEKAKNILDIFLRTQEEWRQNKDVS